MPRKFGLEVEFGGDIRQAIRSVHAAGLAPSATEHGYFGNHDSLWVVKRDGSVSNGGELVSPPLMFDDREQRGQVHKAMEALRHAGAHTSPQAGIHVHIDASDLDFKQVALVARNFIRFEDIVYRLATSGWKWMRPGGMSWCRPFTAEQKARFGKIKTRRDFDLAYFGLDLRGARPRHSDGSRYQGLNLQSWAYRGTIEFRVFNSSLNPDRIQAYIAVCMAMVEDARRGKRRSVNNAYRLGGMYEGTTNPAKAYHLWQQMVRYDAGMSIEDYKLMNRCWKDSQPQRADLSGSHASLY